tara:strand:+ start:37 stop:405 length:369 start_codon:yes stop_codon:yes gene_type:complete
MAGVTILVIFMPNDLIAINSELEDNFPYANKVESNTDIGNDKTRKLGKLYNKTFNAKNNGKPNSTIFLIRSNMTPTDREITVNADIAKHIGGKIWPTNQRSIKGIRYHGDINFLRTLCISND